LTASGRALLARRLGGARTRVRASGATSGGGRRASARTRALLQVERFTTPPGAWVPDEATLTPRGERFLRSLRGKLIAVAGLRCDGHDADVLPGHGDQLTAQPCPRRHVLRRTPRARTARPAQRQRVRLGPRTAASRSPSPTGPDGSPGSRATP
jgi:hypothetical protein